MKPSLSTFTSFVVLVASTGIGLACAHAEPASSAAGSGPVGLVGIEVTGEGAVRVEPDQAWVQIGVEIQGAESVEEAREQAAQAMKAMMKALDGQDVPEAHRRTTSVRIQPQYDYSNRKRRLVGYTASNDLQVRIDDLKKLPYVVDTAVVAGGDASRLMGISFMLSDREAAQAEARKRAVVQARSRAEQLAKAAGVELGPVRYIREGESSGVRPTPPPMSRAMMSTEASTTTPIASGEVEVRVEVFTSWSIL